MLRQLHDQGEYEKIFLFDNGSLELETHKYLANQTIAEAHAAEGLNIHEMWNLGLDMAAKDAGEYRHNVAILNNDINIGPFFLSGLVKSLRSRSDMAVVCPNYDERPGTGIEFRQDIAAGRQDGTGGIAGFAFVLRGELEYRFPEWLEWWFGDNHMLITLTYLRQKRAGIVLDTAVEHIKGGSQTGDYFIDPVLRAKVQEDKRKFSQWLQGHPRIKPF